MNYFEFYGLEEKFFIDEDALKKKFYEFSKKYHPDFHALKSEEEQNELLELSTINNQAYKALQNFNSRLEQILFNKGILITDEKYALTPDFLMEMMEINEAIMDLNFEPDTSRLISLKQNTAEKENEIEVEIKTLTKQFDDTNEEAILLKIKDLWYRKKYLLRIKDSLNKFAS
jgi:molecular chaperone HscB